MSQLRSILEQLVAFDPNDLSAEELAAEITEASYGQQILQTAVAGWVKSLADRGGHHTLGYSSPTAFLVDQTKVSPAHARRVIGYGNAREKAPYAHAAWADGRLSTDQARYLFSPPKPYPTNTRPPRNDWWTSSKASMRWTLVRRSPTGDKPPKAPAN